MHFGILTIDRLLFDLPFNDPKCPNDRLASLQRYYYIGRLGIKGELDIFSRRIGLRLRMRMIDADKLQTKAPDLFDDLKLLFGIHKIAKLGRLRGIGHFVNFFDSSVLTRQYSADL